MSEAAIRAAIVDKMEAVSGIGVVHDRRRYARSLADFMALMTTTGGTVHGWIVHRQNTVCTKATLGSTGKVDRVHTFEISGLMEFDDAGDSAADFQAVLDGMIGAFESDPNLGGTCLRHDQLQVTDVDETPAEELGGDIFHTAACVLVVTERGA